MSLSTSVSDNICSSTTMSIGIRLTNRIHTNMSMRIGITRILLLVLMSELIRKRVSALLFQM